MRYLEECLIQMYANPAKLVKLDTYIMHWVAVYLDKVGIVKRLLLNLLRLCCFWLAFPPGQQANNSCQRATVVVVVQVDVGVYSIVTIIFINKLTRCYLQVIIL